MRKIITLILIMLIALPAFSQPVGENQKPFEAGVEFDWISKTQIQRDENIKEIQTILFNDDTVSKYEKGEFKQKYSDFLKDKDFLKNYEEISNGKKEDADKNYCGFYWNKLLIAYGIQYKKNMGNIFYYDSLGNLRWVDVFSKDYPVFPYWSYQYYRNGKMVAAYYYKSSYDQYIFDSNKRFQGRWYKENMYNRNAKIIMTRTAY